MGAWLGALIWAGTVFWLSSRTGPEIEEINIFDVWDKAAHFTAFLAGAVPLACAFRWSFIQWSPKRVFFTTLAVIALYGALDELHQLFTPNRSGADIYDWTADALGGLAGALFTTWILYARTQGSHRPAPAGN